MPRTSPEGLVRTQARARRPARGARPIGRFVALRAQLVCCLSLSAACNPAKFDKLASGGAAQCAGADCDDAASEPATIDEPEDASTPVNADAASADAAVTDAGSTPDAESGAEPPACEAAIDSDPDNCGGCGRRCLGPDDGLPVCRERDCYGRVLRASAAASELSLHGTREGGSPFRLTCPPGQVVTGIDGVSGAETVYSLQAACGSLRLSAGETGIAVALETDQSTASAGGNVQMQTAYTRSCPESMVVSAVSGSLEYWSTTTTIPNVKKLAVRCSTVHVDAAGEISLGDGPTLSIGADSAAPLEPFSDACGATGVVTGFAGNAGAYLDGVAVLCAELALQELPGELAASGEAQAQP